MQMNDENIQTEKIKQVAEPEFKFPDDAESTSRPNETAEVVTRETAEETNTELLQSIDKKLDMLLAAQAATQAARRNNREYTYRSKNRMCKGRNPQRYGGNTDKTCVASLHHGRRSFFCTGRGEE